jgi:flagellar basal-body rod protein FlgF
MLAPSLVLLSNQQALQRAMDIVANNIANSSTTGFKREGIEFDTLLSQPAPGESINYVVDRATYRDPSNGPIEVTGNTLDFAIQGSGYFQVQGPNGKVEYTRSGAFQINNQGQLVTLAGLPVLGDSGQAIVIPDTTTELTISGDGFLSARVDNGSNLSQLGKISIVKFENEQQLQSQGNGLYTSSQPSAPASSSTVVQGALEQSNVQSVKEMTQMIHIMRSYEQAANMISQENGRLNNAITTLSKTSAS